MLKEKLFAGIFAFFLIMSFTVAQQSSEVNTGGGEMVGVDDATVCCEQTISGLFCQDVLPEQCSGEGRQAMTSCESTSFCQTGWCFDSQEGTCLDNTPQVVCNAEDGTWSAEKPAQCDLGCCVLDDQAAFVTLTRCKALSGNAGIETNWDATITDQAQCVLTAGSKEKGACVFWQDFEKTCKFTTRENCNEESIYQEVELISEQGNGLVPAPAAPAAPTENNSGENDSGDSAITGNVVGIASAQEQVQAKGIVDFYAGKLCSAEELGTNCAATQNTLCLPGKEEVYFVDTCGNPANIYDAGGVNNQNYWNDIVEKVDSCGAGTSNEDSQSCGNCNYPLGSFCREATEVQPTYGENICQSLNCIDAEGHKRIHGESWCIYDGGETGAPGSRAYRQLCNNGEVVVEACSDYRQEECIESTTGGFSQAACRVNRWQDCTAQKDQLECENSDKRDCKWLDGIENVLFGSVLNGTTPDANSLGAISQAIQEAGGVENIPRGACVPEMPPGFNYDTDEATTVCAQANAVCPVKYEKSLLDGEWECVEHCECLPGGPLEKKRVNLCMQLGDCGPKVNFAGDKGNGRGYDVTEQELEEEDD